jgi:hypothetical protein
VAARTLRTSARRGEGVAGSPRPGSWAAHPQAAHEIVVGVELGGEAELRHLGVVGDAVQADQSLLREQPLRHQVVGALDGAHLHQQGGVERDLVDAIEDGGGSARR